MRLSSQPSAHACNVMAKYIYALLNEDRMDVLPNAIRKCNLHTKEGIKYKLPGSAFILITPAKRQRVQERSQHKKAPSTKVSGQSRSDISSQSSAFRGVAEPTNLPPYTSTLLYSISVRDAMYYCIGDITAPLSECLQIFVHDFALQKTDEEIQSANSLCVFSNEEIHEGHKENNSLIASLTNNLKSMFAIEDNLRKIRNYKLLKQHFKELAELYSSITGRTNPAKTLTSHITRHVKPLFVEEFSDDGKILRVSDGDIMLAQPLTIDDYAPYVLKLLHHNKIEGEVYVSLRSDALGALEDNIEGRSKHDLLSELKKIM